MIGTLISALVFGIGIYVIGVKTAFINRKNLGSNAVFDCLLFGALIAATDPVACITILSGDSDGIRRHYYSY